MSSKEEKFPNQNNTGTIKKLIKKLLDKLDDTSEFYDTSEFSPVFLVVLFMCICFVAAVVREYREDMLWQHEKNEHHCRVTEIRSGQSAWTCNDGAVRWRTSTPDDQRYLLWEKFKADHACRLIESRDEDNNGPAREAWKCDNDVVYVKNID
ncbi:TPA: hypothetical protein RLU23_004851 [Escherichia coli]|nr:hypothetical protein [Escherichia coli]